MRQERLMSIESDVLHQIDFEDVINEYSDLKCREKCFKDEHRFHLRTKRSPKIILERAIRHDIITVIFFSQIYNLTENFLLFDLLGLQP